MTLIQLIELFYDGCDDKVYIDLYEGSDAAPIFSNIRIINGQLRDYCDRKIIGLFESSRLSIIVERKKDA
jgi:hypothetical protein